MATRVTLDLSRFQRLLSRVGGPGERNLRARAERVAAQARINAAGNGSIPQGIVVGPYTNGSISVISTHPATQFVHDGTRPHRIYPRRAGGVLRFEVGGRVVFARVVNHPGYRGNPFLTDALRDVL